MSFTVKRSIFVHDFVNLPREDFNCNIDLDISDSSGIFILEKQSAGTQTKYLLTVKDPSVVGLTTSDQLVVERMIANLILSMNLHLSRTCISLTQWGILGSSVAREKIEGKGKIDLAEKKGHVKLVDTIVLKDKVIVTMGTREEISEKSALLTHNNVLKTMRFKITLGTPLKIVNLAKALDEYEDAMSTFDRFQIFKHLFNTIEFCTNWVGTSFSGTKFDEEASAITKVPQADILDWRDLYNRTKHVDQTPMHVSKFVVGIERISSIVRSVRKASQTAILNRLASI